MTADGLITIRSNYGPKETMDRLESEVKGKGLTVFPHVDHAAGATAGGLSLDPTDLLIFGNAKGGTPLMQAVQTIGIDLPLKILVWRDAPGQTWLSYNDPHWLVKRHGIDGAAATAVNGLASALAGLVQAPCPPRTHIPLPDPTVPSAVPNAATTTAAF